MDLSYEGNGVVKIDDFPVFVPNALPGEEITVKITKVTSHFAWGRVMDWQTKSPDRVDVKDKKYIQTGIAPLGHLKYEAQLKFKQHQIQELLAKAHLDEDGKALSLPQQGPSTSQNGPRSIRNRFL